MITRLHINKFRLLSEMDFELAPALTAIAGHNATGKSTILGIIGNSAALPAKDGKTITGKAFGTEFSEILKGSHDKDSSGAIGYIEVDGLSILDSINPSISLRVTWQNKGKRFRVLPKRKYHPGKSPLKNGYDNKKLQLPSYYLGLSRLYPIGETNSDIMHNKVRLSLNEMSWYCHNYVDVLSLDLEQFELEAYKNKEKSSIGITTEQYDFLCNSAGQDNLSQIMMVLLSFHRLKKSYEESGRIWEGGLMLIDEVDATLHPYAQTKLISLLYQESKDLGIQILFTTHSLPVLETVNRLHNKHADCSILYLTNANGPLELLKNPSLDAIRNDMEVTSLFDDIEQKRISLYSEDDEARYFIKKLLVDYMNRIRLINISEGSDKLLSLLENDPDSFCRVLFVLDGDVKADDSHYTNLNYQHCNLLTLPGGKRPEQVLFEYITNLPADHQLLIRNRDSGFTIRKVNESGPLSKKYEHLPKERDKYKQWFKDNQPMLDSLKILDYWMEDSRGIVDNFIETFRNRYNIVASRLHYPRI